MAAWVPRTGWRTNTSCPRFWAIPVPTTTKIAAVSTKVSFIQTPYNDHSPVTEPKQPENAAPRQSDSPSAAAPISDEEPMLFCPLCSQHLTARKCKLFCEQCGYYMSCADYI